MNERRLPPWDASGLIEAAWKRLEPPTRDELARRLGLKAATNLSKLNRGSLRLTPEYAARIVEVVVVDSPGFSLADLGAPSSVVAEADPRVLDRLQELAAAVTAISARVDELALHIAAQELRRDGTLIQSQPTSRRKHRAG